MPHQGAGRASPYASVNTPANESQVSTVVIPAFAGRRLPLVSEGRLEQNRCMSRADKKRSKITSAAMLAFVPVSLAQKLREWVNAVLLPVALVVGAGGMAALMGCAVLWATPPESWPVKLNPALLPIYATLALIAASLLGWGCMQRGLGQMRETVGWKPGGWLFVLLPLACVVIVILTGRGLVHVNQWPAAPWSGRFVRWYPPLLVVTSLLVYLWVQWRKAEGEDRGVRRAGAFALVLPYAALLSVLVFGVESPLLNDSLSDSVGSLGEGAIVAQLTLAYFLSPGASAN
jgi:hypothetical protein